MSTKTKKTNGFILIEILVSLVVLSVGILFLVRSLSMITKSNSQIRNNCLSYLLLDNIYNQLYSKEQISPGKVFLDKKEFLWDLTVNNTSDILKNLTINVTWGKNGSSSTASLSHTTIDLKQ
ncbi:MAG: prepilin-type N-terminal cleavage/methylation domain-containing protein [Candidatus Omnitrophica bacterium]|nr:prepilin-type N-terminal cleavage/methylation domain-containing protein [Candidatus Omnitrophota bacterium]